MIKIYEYDTGDYIGEWKYFGGDFSSKHHFGIIYRGAKTPSNYDPCEIEEFLEYLIKNNFVLAITDKKEDSFILQRLEEEIEKLSTKLDSLELLRSRIDLFPNRATKEETK